MASQLENKIRVEHLLACLGTATLAALARFELPLEAVAMGYAALVIATLLAAWLTRLQVFLYQALVLLGMAAFRISMYNFYHLHESFGSNLSSAVWTIVLLAAGVPVCLAIRRNAAQDIYRAALGNTACETSRAAHVLCSLRTHGSATGFESGSGHDHAGAGALKQSCLCAGSVGQGTQLPACRTFTIVVCARQDHLLGCLAAQ